MATIKSFTDIPQSQVLAKILPLESADMFLAMNGTLPVMSKYIDNGLVTADETAIPCWSLAALLGVIRETIGYTLYGVNNVYISCDLGDKPWKLEAEVYDNEVDACYELILKLHELKML